MISSTFYDLRQVRSDLVDFLVDELGFEPLVSELSSFPVDPDVDTIENCKRRVERDADVLVLVIGGRYGWIDSSSAKSVTNLEYLAARAKGIPIYAFVQKNVLTLVPVWQMSRDADFSGVVDDPRLFSFIEQVRSQDKVWTFEFEYARDITRALRAQFAYLAAEGIEWTRRIHSSGERIALRSLRGQSLRLALEKPGGWEYKLLARALKDEIDDASDLRLQQRLGLSLGVYQHLTVEDVWTWKDLRMAELSGLLRASDIIINETLEKAFGPPGIPGDLELIVFCSKSLGQLYREAIEWSLRVRRVAVDKRFVPVIEEMTNFSGDLIEKIGTLGPMILETIEELEGFPKQGVHIERKIMISTHLPRVDEALKALERFRLSLEKA